jgi:hypothetical protein
MSSADADTVEGAADIGATVDSATSTAVGAIVDVDVGFGGSGAMAVSVGAGPQRQLSLDQRRRRYPPSVRFQDALLFVLPSQ